ncbi:MAG: DNA primase [Phycisphaerales bacterium]|jgi:DNA primase|nr:DNA primase [Phycisphaerales bacterium]
MTQGSFISPAGRFGTPGMASGIDDRQRVREATDIVRLVGEQLALKPKGREFVGLCPFHDDHKPSMSVVPGKQIFHCFVCGSGGDVFTFAQKYFKMDFREALEYLAERAGIELTPRGAPAAAGAGAPGAVGRKELLAAAKMAQDYFRLLLRHPQHGSAARGVIERREISAEMAERFGLGASADMWDGLLRTVQAKGLPESAFVQAGLFKRRDASNSTPSAGSAGVYDAFRHRLMFPICDSIGRVIAFGARKIRDEDEPKYLNSPETPLFDKSGTLYALHLASREIQKKREAIVCEGYTDVIAMHQGGFTHCVATLGTALTRRHAQALRRMCDRVVLMFDGDSAGQKAADRALEVFFGESLDVRIATLARFTDAKDPDELLKREGGAEVMSRVIEGATDLLAFRFSRLREEARGLGPAGLERLVKDEIARLAEMGLAQAPPMRRSLVIGELARLTGLSREEIAREAAARPVRTPAAAQNVESRVPTGAALDALASAIGCVLCEPVLWSAADAQERESMRSAASGSALARAVVEHIERLHGEGMEPSLSALLDTMEQEDARGWGVSVASRVDALCDREASRVKEMFVQCVRELTRDTCPADDPLERIARARAVGGDRRAVPRPGGRS